MIPKKMGGAITTMRWTSCVMASADTSAADAAERVSCVCTLGGIDEAELLTTGAVIGAPESLEPSALSDGGPGGIEEGGEPSGWLAAAVTSGHTLQSAPPLVMPCATLGTPPDASSGGASLGVFGDPDADLDHRELHGGFG